MDRAVSSAHHAAYEYAQLTLGSIQESDDTSPHVILNKDAVLRLTACYMHMYNDLYINQKIVPVKNLTKKENLH